MVKVLLPGEGQNLLVNLVAEARLSFLFSTEIMDNGKVAELHVRSLEHPKSHPESGKHSTGPQDLKMGFQGSLLEKQLRAQL